MWFIIFSDVVLLPSSSSVLLSMYMYGISYIKFFSCSFSCERIFSFNDSISDLDGSPPNWPPLKSISSRSRTISFSSTPVRVCCFNPEPGKLKALFLARSISFSFSTSTSCLDGLVSWTSISFSFSFLWPILVSFDSFSK